jgi:hypothetical protein
MLARTPDEAASRAADLVSPSTAHPIYYRLQMGTGPLSEAYVDGIFDRAMEGLLRRKD